MFFLLVASVFIFVPPLFLLAMEEKCSVSVVRLFSLLLSGHVLIMIIQAKKQRGIKDVDDSAKKARFVQAMTARKLGEALLYITEALSLPKTKGRKQQRPRKVEVGGFFPHSF